MPSRATSFWVGWRFVAGKQRHRLVSFISAVSMIGLALAVALLLLVLSVMNGFEREFMHKILGIAPHASLYSREPIYNVDDVLAKAQPGQGISDVIPFVEIQGLLAAAGKVEPVLIQGMQSEAFKRYFSPHLRSGISALSSKSIVLGRPLADALNVQIGDSLQLLLSDERSAGGRAVRPRIYALSVDDIFDTGSEVDNALAIVELEAAASMRQMSGAIQGVRLRVDDVFSARSMAVELALQLPAPLYATDWTRQYGNLYTAIDMSRRLVIFLLMSIVGIAAFNIVVTLMMVVKHKQSQIAIFRTMGATRRMIVTMFVVQGLAIALVGCVLGVALGCLLSWLAPQAMASIQAAMGVQLLATDVYPINYLPSVLLWRDVVLVCAVAVVMSLLATIYPAWQAAKVQPAKALRYE